MKNRARDDLFVEFPQIFDAASAARHDDEDRVAGHDSLGVLNLANGGGDFARQRRFPARAPGLISTCNVRGAPAQNVQHIADRCAAR